MKSSRNHLDHKKSSKLKYHKHLEENENSKLKNSDDSLQLLPNADSDVVEDKSRRLTKSSELRNSDRHAQSTPDYKNGKLKTGDYQPQSLPTANSDVVSVTDCASQLHQDLQNLLMDKSFADVKLIVNNEVILAHKAILAIRSPVFRKAFEKDTIRPMSRLRTITLNVFISIFEPDGTSLRINNVETKPFKFFIEYLYTGKIREMNEEKAMSLLPVAEKFQDEQLVEDCLEYLKFVLSPENACELLLMADNKNQEELKSYVMDFVLKNSIKILSSSRWSQLKMTNDALATEVLTKLKIATKEDLIPGNSKGVSLQNDLDDGNSKEVQESCSTIPEPEGRQMYKS